MRRLILLLAALGLAAGPTGAVAAAAPPGQGTHHPRARPALGTYSGTTSQGLPITLAVTGGGVDGVACVGRCLSTAGGSTIAARASCRVDRDALTERLRLLPIPVPAHGGTVTHVGGDPDQPSTIAVMRLSFTVTTRGEITGRLRAQVAAADGTSCDSGTVGFTATRRG